MAIYNEINVGQWDNRLKKPDLIIANNVSDIIWIRFLQNKEYLIFKSVDKHKFGKLCVTANHPALDQRIK